MVDLLPIDPSDLMPIMHMEHDIDDHYLIKKALGAASIHNPIRFFKDAQ
jgi:hypothetical protein